jgi:uncharacterized membrane protein
MIQDEERRRRHHDEGYDVGRLLALSGGVSAIAMALLVLDIPVPSSTTPLMKLCSTL